MSELTVSVDANLVASAPPARRAEWESLGKDLADAITSLDARGGSWVVSCDETSFTVVDDRARSASVPRADLGTLFDEYLEVIGQLGTGDADGYSRMDALDMAKKVTHDRAGRVLKRALRELEADHEVARRLFSLLVALAFDTSGIAGAHAALAPREIV